MKTKNLFFMVGLAILGIVKGNAQNTVTIGVSSGANLSPAQPASNGNNTFVGGYSGANVVSGTSNLFMGWGAGSVLPQNTGVATPNNGNENVYLGSLSGISAHTTTNLFNGSLSWGNKNVGIGQGAAFSNQGSCNTLIGSESGGNIPLAKSLTGNYNSFLGYQSGLSMTTGSNNTFLGHKSGINNATGSNNISILSRGPQISAANSGNTLGFNLLVGIGAGDNCSGSNNVIMGMHPSGNTGITTGSNNLYLGRVIFSSAATATALGNDSNNSIILANGNGNQRLIISGTNGYSGFNLPNNSIPQNILEVNSVGGVAGTLGMRFRGISNPNFNTTSSSTRKVLSVNGVGDVILVDDVVGTGINGTTVSAGTNTTVTQSGANPVNYQVNAQNIYTNDGAITASGLRTVTMGDNNLFFKTNGTFTNGTQGTGRVYIGTGTILSPTNFPNISASSQFRLLVEGGILTERVKVALRSSVANWADYVFANEYKLMPLKDVETFVNKNKHLPGIESAEELVKNGLDLGDMQAKQMGKIEELTLYAIEQNKKLENQGKEIEELKAIVKSLLEKK